MQAENAIIAKFPADLSAVTGKKFAELVALCGGPAKVAEGLGLLPGAVYRWQRLKRVAMRDVRALRDLAREIPV